MSLNRLRLRHTIHADLRGVLPPASSTYGKYALVDFRSAPPHISTRLVRLATNPIGRHILSGKSSYTLDGSQQGFATTRFEDLLNWAKKYSLFQYPFVTACCAMEFMALASPRFDMARFGAEAPRFTPRQADLLWVVGTISQRQAPILKTVFDQMAEPKWVLAFGTCASCGGFYDNYATLPGIDKIIPVDIYVPGCPPRPEAAIDGLLLLQDKIKRGDRKPGVVKPRLDPLAQVQQELLDLNRPDLNHKAAANKT